MKQLLALLLLHLLIPPRRVSSDWLLVPAAYDDDGETTLSVLRPRPSEIFQAGELIPSVLSFEGVPRDWLLCVDFDAASSSSSSESSSSPSSLPSSSSSSVECGQPGRHIFEDVPCNSLQPGRHLFAAWMHRPPDNCIVGEDCEKLLRVELSYFTITNSSSSDNKIDDYDNLPPSARANLIKGINDRNVAMAAVQQDGATLLYTSEALQGDREIVLAAVKQKGSALRHASFKLQGDREMAMAAIKQDGIALFFASIELRGDREIVMAAVKQNGQALAHASAELQGDREIVMEAVRKEGDALYYASAALKGDREVVLAAVKENRRARRHASPELLRAIGEANNSNGRALLSSRALVDFRCCKNPPPNSNSSASSGYFDPPPSHALFDVVVWAGALRRSGGGLAVGGRRVLVQATALGLLVEPSSPLRSLAGDVLVIAGEDTRLSTNHHVVAALKGRRFRRILYEAKDVDDPDVETLPMGWQLGVGASALGSDYVDAQLRAAAAAATTTTTTTTTQKTKNGGSHVSSSRAELSHQNTDITASTAPSTTTPRIPRAPEAVFHKKTKLAAAAWGLGSAFLDTQIPARASLATFLARDSTWLSRESWPPEEYFSRLASVHFFLCPTGQGVQSPKLFEAWLAKAVPVVLPTPAFKDLEAQGFPFVVVQRWEEVTPGLLEAYLKDDVQGYGAIDWDRVHFLSSLEGLAENLDR